MSNEITPIVMPKWGLSMAEGKVVSWLVEEGTAITVGLPILEVETDKIANAVEAPDPGVLRRRLAAEGEVLPVKALLGVMAPPEVGDAEIDAYVAAYVVPAAAEGDAADSGPPYQWAEVDGIRVRYARRGEESSAGAAAGSHAGAVPARLRRRPRQLVVQPRRGRCRGAGDRARPARPRAVRCATSRQREPGRLCRLRAAFSRHPGCREGACRRPFDGRCDRRADGAHGAATDCLAGPDRQRRRGRRIDAGYIEGFAAATTRRELKPVVEQLFDDPKLSAGRCSTTCSGTSGSTACRRCWRSSAPSCSAAAGRPAAGGTARGSAVPLTLVWGAKDRIIPPRMPSTRRAARGCRCSMAQATW